MKTIVAFSLMLFFIFPGYSETQESILTHHAIAEASNLIKPGDTLVNLNKLSGGIIRFQISEQDKQVLLNNGLQLNDQAMIIVNDPSMMGKRVMLEVKTFASDQEWYINTLKIENFSQGLLVYVASDRIEMATGWRKDGKIFVVIAVVCVLFFGVIGYLFMLDRKIARLKR